MVDDEGPTIWRVPRGLPPRDRRAGRPGADPLRPGHARASGWPDGRARRLFRGKGKLPSLLVPCRFEARFKPLRFDNRKLREVLGWAPPLDPAERLRRTYGPAPDRPAGSPRPPLATRRRLSPAADRPIPAREAP